MNPNTEILPLMGSKEGIMHISLAFFKWRWSFDSNPGIQHTCQNLVGAVPVYYDLKEYGLGTWFWSFRKLDLTKVKIMWIGYPHMPTEQGKLGLVWKVSGFAKTSNIAD
jgi:aspartate/methionine/tyrosine aminotransferase